MVACLLHHVPIERVTIYAPGFRTGRRARGFKSVGGGSEARLLVSGQIFSLCAVRWDGDGTERPESRAVFRAGRALEHLHAVRLVCGELARRHRQPADATVVNGTAVMTTSRHATGADEMVYNNVQSKCIYISSSFAQPCQALWPGIIAGSSHIPDTE